MRKSILLYLLAFAAIIILMQYVNSSKILQAQNDDIARLMNNLEVAELQLDSIQGASAAGTHFSLLGNEEAMSYFEARGFDASELAQQVQEEIISQNSADTDNLLVPYEGMEGPMRINRISILNHRWIIADFTDGTHWGEVFLSYDVDDEGNLHLTTEKGVLYQ